MMSGEGHFFWGGGFMWLFWVLLIVAVVYLFQGISGNSSSGSASESAMDILKKRYARGEIDKDEFERRRKELEQ